MINVNTTVIYFHGYGSNANSDKVKALKDGLGCNVLAFDIDIDPVKAEAYLCQKIDDLLLTDMHRNDKFIFVGTSLGGWMASKLGVKYKIPAVIINPSCDPVANLAKYFVARDTRLLYSDIVFSTDNIYFFSEYDAVIPNYDVRDMLMKSGFEVHIVGDSDHRFGGWAFLKVIDRIKQM